MTGRKSIWWWFAAAALVVWLASSAGWFVAGDQRSTDLPISSSERPTLDRLYKQAQELAADLNKDPARKARADASLIFVEHVVGVGQQPADAELNALHDEMRKQLIPALCARPGAEIQSGVILFWTYLTATGREMATLRVGREQCAALASPPAAAPVLPSASARNI